VIQGPLPHCAKCQELVQAADEAHELCKQDVLSKAQASGRTFMSSSVVGDADPAFEPVRLALRALLFHVHQHLSGL